MSPARLTGLNAQAAVSGHKGCRRWMTASPAAAGHLRPGGRHLRRVDRHAQHLWAAADRGRHRRHAPLEGCGLAPQLPAAATGKVTRRRHDRLHRARHAGAAPDGRPADAAGAACLPAPGCCTDGASYSQLGRCCAGVEVVQGARVRAHSARGAAVRHGGWRSVHVAVVRQPGGLLRQVAVSATVEADAPLQAGLEVLSACPVQPALQCMHSCAAKI